jgi:hypothetical protein
MNNNNNNIEDMSASTLQEYAGVEEITSRLLTFESKLQERDSQKTINAVNKNSNSSTYGDSNRQKKGTVALSKNAANGDKTQYKMQDVRALDMSLANIEKDEEVRVRELEQDAEQDRARGHIPVSAGRRGQVHAPTQVLDPIPVHHDVRGLLLDEIHVLERDGVRGPDPLRELEHDQADVQKRK